MKKSKKEFILKAHKDACEDYKLGIEKHWPELFPKVEFKVGDWIKSSADTIGRIHRVECGKLWCHFDFYEDERWTSPRSSTKVTKEEIEAHLIAEAKKRGFVAGVKGTSIDGTHCGKGLDLPLSYDGYEDVLVDAEHWTIYQKGQWAEIIDQTPKDLQDLITKYGKEKIKEWL